VAEDRDFVVGLNRRRLSTGPLCSSSRHKSSGGLIQQPDMDTLQSRMPNFPTRSLFPDTIPMWKLFPVQILLFQVFYFISRIFIYFSE
jgi:hypothetical protein